MSTSIRGRNWTFLVYPDIAPENWREIVESWNVPGCISPLHEDDLRPNGEVKRPHWHVLLCFDRKMNISQIEKRIARLNPSYPCTLECVRGVVRYFIHLDDPDAHQYIKEDIQLLSGFRCDSFFS